MINPFKSSEPKVNEIKSPESNSDKNLFDEFKLIRQRAIEHLLDREIRIKTQYNHQIEELQIKLKAELKEIHDQLKELGHTIGITPSTPSKQSKRSRKFHPSVTDDVLKQKLSTLLSGGKKAGSKEIFGALDISRPRFIAFLKNTGFLEITGSKKTTQYSLRA
jgi:hypothetical protein